MAWGRRTLLVGSVVLLAACAAPNLRTSDVETQIAQSLTEQVGGSFAVTCPADVPAEAGTGFACSVLDETSGGRVTVQVRLEDDAGGFTWRVGSAPAPAATPAPMP